MKNRFLPLLSSICVLLLASCVKEPQPIRVTGITLNTTSLSLVEDETADLVATISPKDADNRTVIWSSSNGSVASVNNGRVTALKAGFTDIIAKSDDGGYTASCSVTVIAKVIEVRSVTLSKSELTLFEGDSETITATVKPDDATDKSVTWSSSDATIASVENGEVTAVKEGSATITAKAGDETASCKVVVQKKQSANAIIYYTSLDKSVVEPNDQSAFNASIISNEYVDGVGIITFSEDITNIGNSAFHSCKNLTSITMPESVTEIGVLAFANCSNLSSITMPNCLTVIKDRAFIFCTSLSSIAVPESVAYIEHQVFRGCESLVSITLPESLTSLGYEAFYDCTSLTSIILPKGLTSISHRCFYNCKSLSSITVPEGVTDIGNHAFYCCESLFGITLPDSVNSLGENVFYGCNSLTSIVIPSGVTTIQFAAFLGCSNLASVSLPDSLISIGKYAFTYCPTLSSIIFPENLSVIGFEAFYCCNGLSSISIPESVTSIEEAAFAGCTGLASITVLPKVPPTGGKQMFSATNTCPIYVPKESVNAYKTAQHWSDYADRIQAIPSPSILVPEAVDLGLSVRWASFNLGATMPEAYGDYYAWGETEPKTDYSWATYKWCDGSDHTLTKYNDMSTFGTVDNKTVLEPEDDAAHVILGGNWRMPTEEEWYELREKCSWSWSWIKHGMIVTAPNGNSIFLPSPGHKTNQSSYQVGSNGFYWTSTLSTPSGPYAESGQIDDDYFGSFYCNRFRGQSIRPVTE